MNDERFFDLAMKVIAHQAKDAECVELEALLAREPELRAEFVRLKTDAHLTKDVLPLVGACIESTGDFPPYARERLQTVVRQKLGRPESAAKEPSGRLIPAAQFMPAFMPASESEETLRRGSINGQPAAMRSDWGWRWVLGLAAATAVIVLVALPMLRTANEPVIQLAMLDTAGGTRGAETNELATLQGTWKGSPVQNFSTASELEAWEKNWPNVGGRPAAKIIYDPAAGEVRVSGHSQGKAFQKTFALEGDRYDLAATLQQVSAFVREQTKR